LLHSAIARALGEELAIQFSIVYVLLRDIFFREDGIYGALRHAGAAIDAGVRVDVIQRPFVLGEPGHDTLYRADFCTCAIADTETSNYVSHKIPSFFKKMEAG